MTELERLVREGANALNRLAAAEQAERLARDLSQAARRDARAARDRLNDELDRLVEDRRASLAAAG